MAVNIDEWMYAQVRALPVQEQIRQEITLAVVDDQRLFRESIAAMLGEEESLRVVGTGCTGVEAIELVRCARPDLLLMDIKMPDMNGIEATRQIKAEFPETRVILLATFATDEYALDGLAAGANGFILKDSSLAGLVAAIRAVYSGEQVIASSITHRMVQMLERQTSEKGQREDGLTEREVEMLCLIARGMLAKEIARVLSVSEKTVRNHISSIYRKLEIYDRSQVVIYAMKHGLVDLQ
jgi:DNA-binding NarL/FixJ family response regulator